MVFNMAWVAAATAGCLRPCLPSEPRHSGVPAQVSEALDLLASDHEGRVRARELVLPPGHPLLASEEAEWVRAFVARGADGNASSQVAAVDVALAALFQEVDLAWPGVSRRAYAARVASTRAARLCQWTDVDVPFSAAVLKLDAMDLTYLDVDPAIGPQVRASRPEVSQVVPDLRHALRTLPLVALGREALKAYVWERVDAASDHADAWRAVHPAAPLTSIGLELDRQCELPIAASLSFDIDARAVDSGGSMLTLIVHAPLAEPPGQVWIRRVMTLTCSDGGLAVEDITLDWVDFAPSEAEIVLDVPSQAHLYDQRGSEQVYHGPLSSWPDDIQSRVRRGSVSDTGLHAARGDVDAHRRIPAEPSRNWNRFVGATAVAIGLVVMLGLSQASRRPT